MQSDALKISFHSRQNIRYARVLGGKRKDRRAKCRFEGTWRQDCLSVKAGQPANVCI